MAQKKPRLDSTSASTSTTASGSASASSDEPSAKDQLKAALQARIHAGELQNFTSALRAKVGDPDFHSYLLLWLGGILGWEAVMKAVELGLLNRDRAWQNAFVDCKDAQACIDHLFVTESAERSVEILRYRDTMPARQAFFESDFDGGHVLDYFWNTIQHDYDLWTTAGTKFVAPYLALTQSSGWGKSRLAYELHKHVYVVYCSTMQLHSMGFPERTPHLADRICRNDVTAESIAAYIIASLRVLKSKWSQTNPLRWLDEQVDPQLDYPIAKAINDQFDQCKKELEEDIANRIKQAPPSAMRTYHRKFVKHYLHEQTHTYKAIQHSFTTEVDALPIQGDSLKVVFCFDEATSLVETICDDEQDSCFTLLRRVLSRAVKGIFAVMIGTNSRLSNFAPSQARDPTLKVKFSNFKLFRPVWLTGSADPAQPISKNEVNDLTKVFSFGRPLWRVFLEKGSYTVKELLELARDKLESMGKDVTEEFAAGLLGCAIGLEVASWSQPAELAVAYHMMTAAWISEDRTCIRVANAAEPVLAAAAATILQEEDTLEKVLLKFGSMCKEGIATGGPRGEILTRVVLVLAMYKCLQKKGMKLYTGVVTLKEFLESLFGTVPDGLSKRVKKKIFAAELFFNAFSPTTVSPNQQLLDDCFVRSRALTCQPNQRIVDSLLPCRFRDDIRAVAVQSKRWESDNDSKMLKTVEKLEAGLDNVTSVLNLVFQFGSTRNKVVVEGAKRSTIVAYGLSGDVFPCLSEPIVRAMDLIRSIGGNDHIYQLQPVEQQIVREMLPLMY